MITRTLPAILVTLSASGAAGMPAAAEAGGPCPPPEPTEVMESVPTTTQPLDDRCAIDAEAYFSNYPGREFEDASPTAGPSSGGVVQQTAEAADDEAASAHEPLPPIIVTDEPGVLDGNTFVDAGDSLWVETTNDRESTFALDVDTGSLNVARELLANGWRPEADSVRPEEWINAFSYGDRPATDTDLAVHVESPYNPDAGDTALVRIGVTTREIDAMERPPANITFVIDTSGSMDIRERLGLVQSSLALLVRSLRTDDAIAIVVYGDHAAPVLPPTPVAEWPRIVDAIDSLGPGGSTNMEAGLMLGYEQARESFDPDALNVVVLASDGVANVGVTDPDVLTEEITQAGEDGIQLVTVGYGMGNYNDHLMEQLADMGDGFYAYVDTFAEAVDLFVTNLTPTLTVVAEEAKVQVVFDEDVVARYRLIGYENRELDDSQFTDDTVDAGELGAGHQVTALYEIELAEGAVASTDAELPPVGEVRLRWRSSESGEIVQVDTDLVLEEDADPSSAYRLATLVARTAEVLKGNAVVTERGVTLEQLLVEAEVLAADGVDGATDMVELITMAIHAEDIPAEDDR